MRESIGSRYKIRRVRGRGRKGSQIYVYGFAGVALLYMNPMAKYDGKWYSLKPLHTEGQEYVPSRTEYANWQLTIPFGVGVKRSRGEDDPPEVNRLGSKRCHRLQA